MNFIDSICHPRESGDLVADEIPAFAGMTENKRWTKKK